MSGRMREAQESAIGIVYRSLIDHTSKSAAACVPSPMCIPASVAGRFLTVDPRYHAHDANDSWSSCTWSVAPLLAARRRWALLFIVPRRRMRSVSERVLTGSLYKMPPSLVHRERMGEGQQDGLTAIASLTTNNQSLDTGSTYEMAYSFIFPRKIDFRFTRLPMLSLVQGSGSKPSHATPSSRNLACWQDHSHNPS
jgi:hypothetical protein